MHCISNGMSVPLSKVIQSSLCVKESKQGRKGRRKGLLERSTVSELGGETVQC